VVKDPSLNIKHQFNGKLIGMKQIPVDGWDRQTKTVFQFHSCYWHGHSCSLGTRQKEGDGLRKLKFTDTMSVEWWFPLVEC